MKKPIETKKIIVAALILTITLFIFPLSSFGGGALICPEEPQEGNIEGLVFYFGPDFELELPWQEDPVPVVYAIVETFGSEMTVITPSGQYFYHATLSGGITDEGKGVIYAYDVIPGEEPEEEPVLVFEFESATLNEHFTIDDYDPLEDCTKLPDIVMPSDVDLFFKVKNARLIFPWGDWSQIPFDIMLKLKHSALQIIMFKP